ncbi:MAG: site-specific integrase [Candidatus Competibacteraceae bacterium]|nr:site-specific integrase [Candidatus Competibacteraceae bacterium]
MFDREVFDEAQKEFLSHLLYTRGHRKLTCYAYNSDLGLWADWLQEAGKDWQRMRAVDVELGEIPARRRNALPIHLRRV